MTVEFFELRWDEESPDELVHIIPSDDVIGHEALMTCACGPTAFPPTARRPETLYRHQPLMRRSAA